MTFIIFIKKHSVKVGIGFFNKDELDLLSNREGLKEISD